MQPPSYKQTLETVPLVSAQPVPQNFWDQRLIAKLGVIKNMEVRQGNVLLEGLTLGVWPNTYIIGDRDLPVPVGGCAHDHCYVGRSHAKIGDQVILYGIKLLAFRRKSRLLCLPCFSLCVSTDLSCELLTWAM